MADPRTAYVWPVEGLKAGEGVTNPYGGKQYRSAGFQGSLPPYNVGVDIALGQGGRNVLSPVDGKVVGVYTTSGQHYGYGNSLLIENANGERFRLSHLADLPAYKVGDQVRAGQAVGRVGATGNATGPHLDFEYYPKDYTKAGHRGTADPLKTLSFGAGVTDTRPRDPADLVAGTRADPAPPVDGTGANPRFKPYYDLIAQHRTAEEAANKRAEALRRDWAALRTDNGDQQNAQPRYEAAIKAAEAEAASARNAREAAQLEVAQAQVAEASKAGTKSITLPDGSTVTSDELDMQTKLANLERIRREAAQEQDPLKKRQLELQIQTAEEQVANAQAARARQEALLPGELAQQGAALAGTQASTAASQASTARTNALLPGEIRQQGATLAGTQATTAQTQANTARTNTLLPGEVAQQGATLAGTQATTAQTQFTTDRGRQLLPGELAQQGATLANTQATTAKTLADTLTESERAARERSAIAEAAKKDFDNALAARTQAIQDLVAKGRLSQPDAMKMLGQFKELMTLQLQQRKQEQEAAQTALNAYNSTGLATANNIGNVMQATAPTQGLEEAARSLGIASDSPIFQGVSKTLASMGRGAFEQSKPGAAEEVPSLPSMTAPPITPSLSGPPPATLQAFAASPGAPGAARVNTLPSSSPAGVVPPGWTEVAEDLGPTGQPGMAQNYEVNPATGERRLRGAAYRIGGGGGAPLAFAAR